MSQPFCIICKRLLIVWVFYYYFINLNSTWQVKTDESVIYIVFFKSFKTVKHITHVKYSH